MEFGTSQNYFALGIGVVVTLLAAAPMKRWVRVTLFGMGVCFIVVGLWGMVGDLGRDKVQAGDVKDPPSVNQTITNSPGGINALGDVTVNREPEPWVLTEDQRRKLITALSKVSQGNPYKVEILFPAYCDPCNVSAEDLVGAWSKASGWEASMAGSYIPKSNEQGVIVPIDMEGCSPEALTLVMNAFETAEIKYEKVRAEGVFGSGFCVVVIGRKLRS